MLPKAGWMTFNLAARAVLRVSMRPALPLCLSLAACASAPPAPVPRPAGLPRSSIAAVLTHRQELALTPDQVSALQQRDDALEREDAPLLARMSQTGGSVGHPEGGRTAADAPAGSGHGGRHGQRPQVAPAARSEDALARLDDNDTRAYLEVERSVLTESQRPRAREIASRFREELYDRQHRTQVPADSSAGGR